MGKIRIGMCDWCFPINGLAGMRYAADMGISAYQITPGPVYRNYPLKNPFLQEQYLKCAGKYHMDITTISADALLSFPMTADIGTELSNKAEEAIRTCIDIANAMKIPVVITSNARASIIHNAREFENTVVILKRVCEYASSLGITVVNENYLGVEDSLWLMERVGYPNFNIYYDSQNPYCFGDIDATEVYTGLSESIKKLGQIHVKDGKEKRPGACLLGQGDSGFYKTMEALRKTDFQGDIFIENFYCEPYFAAQNVDDVFELVRSDIETLKSCFKDII